MGKSANKVLNRYQFVQFVEQCKAEGKKVVFTNGCFDILHYGHIDYLEKARELGDVLVLGVNTDESIHRLKGSQRPIIQEFDRVRMLAAFEFIDAITLFDNDTPHELIAECIPSVLVKGSDYEIKDIVGGQTVLDNGGEVKTIDYVDGYSTSSIIQKIRDLI
ncbi:D-glycero-beta-D-manno-heptose 1-phosphate adenylyltransferase [Cyclobacteriaceae bacterium]|nr:D-glycero-beta-D-manno-heptose 1-phosphate adenylyltransferase [Cyclobacteriaceae bacterium]